MTTFVLRGLAAVIVLAMLAQAVGAAESARQILDRRKLLEHTTQHWDTRYQRMKMTIVGRGGGERVREIDFLERKYPDDEEKAIVFFLAPAELKGTGFLAFNHKGRPADQWLYLSELNRVRQISASTRKQSFVGTDFSYHDLDLLAEMHSWSEEDASSVLSGEQTIEGTPCHVIEFTPRREDIGYKHIVLWLGREDLLPRQVEFYEERPPKNGNGDSPPDKRVRQGDVQMVGSIPVARRVLVETPAAGTKTNIAVMEIQFNLALEDRLFTQRSLERGHK